MSFKDYLIITWKDGSIDERGPINVNDPRFVDIYSFYNRMESVVKVEIKRK
tara:strand:+ start:684 stop:836 length:153 start_codon:yes stop_codon:yes gene_type:complete